MSATEAKLGAAILGLYAAVKVCIELGLDVRKVLALVEAQVRSETHG